MNNVINFINEHGEHPKQREVDIALQKNNKIRVSLYKGLTFVSAKKGKGEF